MLLIFFLLLHQLSILPLKDNSPVIAKLGFKGLFRIKDKIAEVIVTPADGPSLGIAPSGACI